MLTDEQRQEYLLVYALGWQYLFAVERGEGERPDFTLIDEVMQIEEDIQLWRIGLRELAN